MKYRLAHEVVDRVTLKELLARAEIVESRAAGSANIYRLIHEGEELIVTSLPDGSALKVGLARAVPQERRQRGNEGG